MHTAIYNEMYTNLCSFLESADFHLLQMPPSTPPSTIMPYPNLLYRLSYIFHLTKITQNISLQCEMVFILKTDT